MSGKRMKELRRQAKAGAPEGEPWKAHGVLERRSRSQGGKLVSASAVLHSCTAAAYKAMKRSDKAR